MSLWPKGSFGIPRSGHDCPRTDKFPWITGRISFTQVDEEEGFKHSWSESYHQKGPFSTGQFSINICVKLEKTLPETMVNRQPAWPAGTYCIYRIGHICPTGMHFTLSFPLILL